MELTVNRPPLPTARLEVNQGKELRSLGKVSDRAAHADGYRDEAGPDTQGKSTEVRVDVIVNRQLRLQCGRCGKHDCGVTGLVAPS